MIIKIAKLFNKFKNKWHTALSSLFFDQDIFNAESGKPRSFFQCLSSQSGQVAVILVIVLAIGLVLYAVVLNLGRVSGQKLTTMAGATHAASTMASMIASYGEQLFQVSLGGETKKCGWTGLLAAILTVVIAIIAVVITVFCAPAGAATWTAGTLAIAGLVFALAALVLEVAVVQPGINQLWNKMMMSLTLRDRTVEMGVQRALQTTVTDRVQFPDLIDVDTDARFGNLSDITNKDSAPDYIGRYAFYYTQRLRGITPAGSTLAIDNFITALGNLVDGPPKDTTPPANWWGLHDPVCTLTGNNWTGFNHPCCTRSATMPAFCDPCCQPALGDLPACCQVSPPTCAGGEVCATRPACCDTVQGCTAPADLKGWLPVHPNTGCAQRSPFGATFPWIFQKYPEDTRDQQGGVPYLSFRERMGLDDDNDKFFVNPAQPNWDDTVVAPPYPIAADKQILRAPPPISTDPLSVKFVRADAPSLNDPPTILGNPLDRKQGIFPFLYKIADWRLQLQQPAVPITYPVLDFNDVRCNLCDVRVPVDGRHVGVCPAGILPVPNELQDALGNQQLILPATFSFKGPDSLYSGGYCVDEINTGDPGQPPQLSDRVSGQYLYPLLLEDNICAVGPTVPSAVPPALPPVYWKRGSDRYCGSWWPYSYYCDKYGSNPSNGAPFQCVEYDSLGNAIPTSCACGEAGAGPNYLWPDDGLDEIYYGLEEFFDFAYPLLRQPLGQVKSQFEDWYAQAAEWIEPGCGVGCVGDPTPQSFTQLARWGVLFELRGQLRAYWQAFHDFVRPPGNEYVGGACNIAVAADDSTVWCIPPAQGAANKYGINQCAGVNPEEAATFDANGNGTRGDLNDVVECLRFNIEDPAYAHNPATFARVGPPLVDGMGIPYLGNLGKFKACRDQCGLPRCSVLPRSLVPGMNEHVFAGGDPTLITVLTACLATDTYVECLVDCNNGAGGPLNPVPALPAFDPGTAAAAIQAVVTFCNANPTLTTPCPSGAIVPDIVCNSPTLASDIQNCACSYPSRPAALGSCEPECAGIRPYPAGSYLRAVEDALVNLGLDCDPNAVPHPNFREMLDQTIKEAEVQKIKFEKRYKFLRGRLTEAEYARQTFVTATDQVTLFLDGGAPSADPTVPRTGTTWDGEQASADSVSEHLIWLRMHSSTINPHYTSVAVYVWQDEPKEDLREGNWHAVKAEVRIPSRCNGACWDDTWPTIITYTTSWGMKRCYELTHMTGLVKARVVRYDQANVGLPILFPNQSLLWQPRYDHPTLGPGTIGSTASIIGAGGICAGSSTLDTYISTTGWDGSANPTVRSWYNAFMLNTVPEANGNDGTYTACWDYIHNNFLQHGVESEVCAAYYMGQSGFQVKFVDCDVGFKTGQN